MGAVHLFSCRSPEDGAESLPAALRTPSGKVWVCHSDPFAPQRPLEGSCAQCDSEHFRGGRWTRSSGSAVLVSVSWDPGGLPCGPPCPQAAVHPSTVLGLQLQGV